MLEVDGVKTSNMIYVISYIIKYLCILIDYFSVEHKFKAVWTS